MQASLQSFEPCDGSVSTNRLEIYKGMGLKMFQANSKSESTILFVSEGVVRIPTSTMVTDTVPFDETDQMSWCNAPMSALSISNPSSIRRIGYQELLVRYLGNSTPSSILGSSTKLLQTSLRNYAKHVAPTRSRANDLRKRRKRLRNLLG